MTCGCRIKVDHLNPENYFVAELLRCPMHEAAGEMLKALKVAQRYFHRDSCEHETDSDGMAEGCENCIVNAAIAKAEKLHE